MNSPTDTTRIAGAQWAVILPMFEVWEKNEILVLVTTDREAAYDRRDRGDTVIERRWTQVIS